MVTCFVWAGILVVVLLLILVVGWAMLLGALPIWPPVVIAAITFNLLAKLRVPRTVVLAIAGISTLALIVDLPFGLPSYSVAMREIGYTGNFGGALGLNLADLPRLLWLSLPFCLLSGAAVGSGLAAVRGLRNGGGGTRRRPRGEELRGVRQ